MSAYIWDDLESWKESDGGCKGHTSSPSNCVFRELGFEKDFTYLVAFEIILNLIGEWICA